MVILTRLHLLEVGVAVLRLDDVEVLPVRLTDGVGRGVDDLRLNKKKSISTNLSYRCRILKHENFENFSLVKIKVSFATISNKASSLSLFTLSKPSFSFICSNLCTLITLFRSLKSFKYVRYDFLIVELLTSLPSELSIFSTCWETVCP